MKCILIAADKEDAKAWAERHGAQGMVVVTPHSPHSARGVCAVAIYATERARACRNFDRLYEESVPSLLGGLRPYAIAAPEES